MNQEPFYVDETPEQQAYWEGRGESADQIKELQRTASRLREVVDVLQEDNRNLRLAFRRVHNLLHHCNAVFVPGNDAANGEIAKALRETEHHTSGRWLIERTFRTY